MVSMNGRIDLLSSVSVLTGTPSLRPVEPQVGRLDCPTCLGNGHLGDNDCTTCHGTGSPKCADCTSVASVLDGDGCTRCLDCHEAGAHIAAEAAESCPHALVELLSVNGRNLDGAQRVCAVCKEAA